MKDSSDGATESTIVSGEKEVDYKNLSRFNELFIAFVSGSVGATASVYVGQSLDTVKVKMQTYPHLYTNSVDCFVRTFRDYGIKGLYAGTIPSLVANIAENSVLFTAYTFCQKAVFFSTNYIRGKKDDPKFVESKLTPLQNAFSGSLASLFSSTAICPTELIKCRLQAMTETNASKGITSKFTLLHIIQDVYTEGGARGFFKGFLATLVREVPGYFCFFGGYEFTKRILATSCQDKRTLQTIIAGGVGGTCLWIATYPIDVIKSRIQVLSPNLGILALVRQIVKKRALRFCIKACGQPL